MSENTAIHALPKGFKLHSKDRVYEIVKVLGSGSFGITYLATSKILIGNISTTVKFAIKEHYVSSSCYREKNGASVKTVPTAKAVVDDSRADFIMEANRLKSMCLKSRNIVKVNETFEANGTAYYVMEFLDGGSLSKCSEEDAVSIVLQVADALKIIHNEHVLHLDIKPDNIMLESNEANDTYPVLIDFGISKHFDNNDIPTSSLNAKGASPGYAPQEQYAGVSEFSPKYDIYALGAVLLYLCTGKNPPDAFRVSPNQQELKEILEGKVSAKVEKAILNAMKPNSQDRTSSVEEFCDDLLGVDFTPVLKTSVTEVEISNKSTQQKIPVESNVKWNVQSNEDWCKVSRNDNGIVIIISENNETGTRKCNVTITSKQHNLSEVIHVTQTGLGTVVVVSKKSRIRSAKLITFGIAILAFIIGLLLPSPIFRSNTLFGGSKSDVVATIDTTEMKYLDGLYNGTVNVETKKPYGFGVLTKPGRVYEGNWKDGKLKYGKRTTKDYVYVGKFNDDLDSHGFGIQTYTRSWIDKEKKKGNNEKIIKEYIGNWNKNYKTGLGRMVFDDSSMIFGNFKDGFFQPIDGANYNIGDCVYGIDVSHYQEDIDWDQLALYCDENGNVYHENKGNGKFLQPVFFAYIKATEGSTWKDETYDIRNTEAERHGISKGAYHFLRLGSDIKSQIQNFTETVRWTSGDLPPALDIEVEDEIKACGDDGKKMQDMAFTWLEEIERRMNVKPIIYTTENIINNYLSKDSRFKNYTCWIARHRKAGPDSKDWRIWQMTETGKMSGHSGNVDINLFKGNYNEFQEYLKDLETQRDSVN